jgi:hypothetical protein
MKFRLPAVLLTTVLTALLFASTSFAEGMAGEINDLKGKVEIMKAGDAAWNTAEAGLPVEQGDKLKTGPRSMCDIELDDGSLIHLAANSETQIETLDIKEEEHVSSFQLFFGKIIASVNKLKVTKMQIKTPTSVAAVRGTEFAVEATEKDTEVGVFDGSVAVKGTEVSGEELEAMIEKDQQTSVAAGQKPLPPGKLGDAMRRNREYMKELRGRVKALREKLKRVPPEERMLVRKRAGERFNKLRNERQDMHRKLQQRKENIRQKRLGK